MQMRDTSQALVERDLQTKFEMMLIDLRGRDTGGLCKKRLILHLALLWAPSPYFRET
jgi:hypothetical protein